MNETDEEKMRWHRTEALRIALDSRKGDAMIKADELVSDAKKYFEFIAEK